MLSLTALGVVFLFLAFVLLNIQYIKDKIIILANPTPAPVLALVQDSGMNSTGQFYYKASQPVLAPAQSFNQVCRPNQEQSEAILGCYTRQRIYIYDVQDQDLAGVKEVTATHEAMHAVYERLSASDKIYVHQLLDKEYESRTDDTALQARMKYYVETEPGQFYNELHSILATERGSLHRSLEEYYQQYFSDRQKVVALYEGYEGKITETAQRAQALSDEINHLQNRLEQRIARYNAESKAVNEAISSFNTAAGTAGYFQNQDQFNSARQAIASRAAALDAEYEAIQQEMNRHEQLVKEYNSTAIRLNEINTNLNSTIEPIKRF